MLLFWFVGIALTFAGVDVPTPAALHLAAVGVLGWVFGPAFWQAVGRGGSRDDREG